MLPATPIDMKPAGLPPFLLVHGAYHGGWCWAPVARILRARGHEVFTPTQTGLGERRHLLSRSIDMETFVIDIMNVVEFERLENVVLVAHSYGARAANGVVDRVPEKIRRLIYIDGGLALSGVSRLDSLSPESRDKRIQSSEQFDGGISVPPPPAEYFGIRDPSIARWMNALMTPQPLNAERTAVTLKHPIGNGRAATYIRCSSPPLPSVDASAEYARKRTDWRFLEIAAGHEAMLTHPEQIASILLEECAD